MPTESERRTECGAALTQESATNGESFAKLGNARAMRGDSDSRDEGAPGEPVAVYGEPVAVYGEPVEPCRVGADKTRAVGEQNAYCASDECAPNQVESAVWESESASRASADECAPGEPVAVYGEPVEPCRVGADKTRAVGEQNACCAGGMGAPNQSESAVWENESASRASADECAAPGEPVAVYGEPVEPCRVGADNSASAVLPVIALTGPMAAGKNRAADFLQEAGCAVIDADMVAHQALCNVQSAVIKAFAPDCARLGIRLTDESGTINRAALAKIVFSSPQKLSLHESIIHPEITRLLESFLSRNKDRVCVLNATVLYKTPLIKRCAFVIYIDAPFLTRLIRAKKRDSSSVFHLLKRFSAQKKLYAQYRKLNVDIYKVQNRGKPAKLQKKLLRILKNRT